MNDIKNLLILAERYDQNREFKKADLLTKEAMYGLGLIVDPIRKKIVGPIIKKAFRSPAVRRFVVNWIVGQGVPILVDSIVATLSGGSGAVLIPYIHTAVSFIMYTPISSIPGLENQENNETETKTVAEYLANILIDYTLLTIDRNSLETEIMIALKNREKNESIIKVIISTIKEYVQEDAERFKEIFMNNEPLINAVKQRAEELLNEKAGELTRNKEEEEEEE